MSYKNLQSRPMSFNMYNVGVVYILSFLTEWYMASLNEEGYK